MPNLATVYATQSSNPYSVTGTTGDSYTDATCTATLTAGRWLIMVIASHQNRTGSGSLTIASELEIRLNSTRIGTARWANAFGGFVPDSNTGHSYRGFVVATVANGDTVSVWVRRRDLGGATGGDVIRVDDAQIIAINLDLLTEGTDYVYAAAANSDTSEVVTTDATWVTANAAGRIGHGASEIPYTAPATDNYWVLAQIESALDGTAGTVERSGARLRMDNGSGFATIGSGEQYHSHVVGNPTTFQCSFVEEDWIALTSGDQPVIRWEVNNDTLGDAGGFRRSRVFMLRAGALANSSAIVNAGNGQIASGGGTTEAANGLSFNFGTSLPTFITGSCNSQHGGSNWARLWLHEDAGDVHHPAGNRDDVYTLAAENMSSTGDILSQRFMELGTLSGSQVWRYAKTSDSGAMASSFGRNRGDTASVRTVLIALQLTTAPTGAFSGAIAASTTVAGSFVSAYTGAVACTSTLTGTFASGFSATCAANTTVAGAFASALIGAVSCTGTLVATFQGVAAVVGTIPAIATLAGTFAAALQGTCAAIATFAGTFSTATADAFNGTVACTSTFALAGLTVPFSGTCAATSTLVTSFVSAYTGAFTGTTTFAGTFVGVGTLGGSIGATCTFAAEWTDGTTPGANDFDGTCTAAASFVGVFHTTAQFQGTVTAAAIFRWSQGIAFIPGVLGVTVDTAAQHRCDVDEVPIFTVGLDTP